MPVSVIYEPNGSGKSDGFDDSGIRMNTWISKKDKWTLAELEEHSEYLMGRALMI